MNVTDFTFKVHGRDMSFSEEQLIAILEKHFPKETMNDSGSAFTKRLNVSAEHSSAIMKQICLNTPKKKISSLAKTTYRSPLPTEETWFSVNPKSIDDSLFATKRANSQQEMTRQIILEALAKRNELPRAYNRPFNTVILRKTWDTISVQKLIDYSFLWGDHIANWIEQALEWAQRIQNGESWESLCNQIDSIECHRLVLWKDQNLHSVGGFNKHTSEPISASHVSNVYYVPEDLVSFFVPLVICYN